MRIAPNELRRSGVTLIEVLVAIFVASIGLLALLALFPVGALSMRQALKDSRCAQTSINAMALFKSQKLGLDSDIARFFGTVDPYTDSFSAGSQFGIRNSAAPNGPSYPIYIDPLGRYFKSSDHLPVYQEPSSTYPRIPRIGVSLVTAGNFASYQRWFSLLDDIEFDPNNPGQPGPAGGSVTRDPRYTFAYMVRRPYAGNATSLDVTVVVYAGRALNTTMGSFEEIPCNQVVFTAGSTQVTVPYGGAQTQPQRPTIKPGGWILDATMPDVSKIPGDTTVPQGYFYRVVDVIDNGTSLSLELQSPARQSTSNGMLVYLDNVAEVFEKGTISLQ